MPKGEYRRIKGGKMRGDYHIPRGYELDEKTGTLIKKPKKKNKTYYRRKAIKEVFRKMREREAGR